VISMSDVGRFLLRNGETVTLRTRTLGARDAETGWPVVGWSTSSIQIYIKPHSEHEVDTPAGRVTEVRYTIYSSTYLRHRDEIIWNGNTYEIEMEPFHIISSR